MHIPRFQPPSFDSDLAWGTVGWTDDTAATYYDLGDGSATEQQITLVRVTLFRGRDPTVALDQARAQGQQTLCQLSPPFFCVPPRNTRVLVALPSSGTRMPGNGVILLAVDTRASQIFGPSVSIGDLVISALLGNGTIALRANSNVEVTSPTLVTLGDPSATSFVGLAKLIDQAVTTITQVINGHLHPVAGAATGLPYLSAPGSAPFAGVAPATLPQAAPASTAATLVKAK
jgi:hypothetical protein